MNFDDIFAGDHITNALRYKSRRDAFDLLRILVDRTGKPLKIATSESLTGGLIMSTLVDIPFGGQHKYGSTVVYDTNAKRVLNNVTVVDVYTHKCAMEMAIGLLHNTNASLAISVTGNSMPLNADVHRLGEVFIGVAGYVEDGSIIYSTTVHNSCYGTLHNECSAWVKTIDDDEKAYNDRHHTAFISEALRYSTVSAALTFAKSFISEQTHLSVPETLTTRYNEVQQKPPPTKYSPLSGSNVARCVTNTCEFTCEFSVSSTRVGIKEYPSATERTCVHKTKQ